MESETRFIAAVIVMGLGLLIGCVCPILSTMDNVVALEALFVGVAMAGAGGVEEVEVDRHRLILGERLGLPMTYDAERWDALRQTMNRDKKARGSALRFVLLDAIGRPIVTPVADDSMLFAAYSEIAG